MDRKSITVIAFCFVLLLLWSFVIVPKLYPPKPLPPGGTNTLSALSATQTVASPYTVTNQASAAPVPTPVAPLPKPQMIVNTNVPEQLLTVTNQLARYTFTSYGGGLKRVELVKYPETVASRHRPQPETNRLATLNSQTPAPTLAVLDGPDVQGDGIFHLTRTGNSVRAEKTLTNGLTLLKEFSLGTNYLVTATVVLRNDSTNTLSLPPQQWVVGTATPMGLQDSGYAEGTIWYNGKKTHDISASWFANRTLGCLPGKPRTVYRSGAANVVWAGVHNQFFTLVAMPQEPASELIVHQFKLTPPTPAEIEKTPHVNRKPEGYEAMLVYPALTLAPHQTLQRQFYLFAGPKKYSTLATLAARFHNKLDAVMSFGWTGFISKALLLWMNWLHRTLDMTYGWAIIAITVIIKLVFWPLTQSSTRSMKRMQELAPQMKALQAKYKDDPQKLSQKQWEFWKKNKVNPMGGCLPMVLQMPVLFGFFYMIRSAIELRGASWLWVADLSKPDTIFLIPGINFPFNLLPLLMAGTSVWQAHLTPQSPGADAMQQKLMRYMPLIMVAIFYNLPSGLTLYYTVQSLLSVVQTKMIKTQPKTAPAAAVPTPALTSSRKKRK